MNGSAFKLVGGRYIFFNDDPRFTVHQTAYAGKILDKIREIESKKTSAYALKVLGKMESDTLKYQVRGCTNLDVLRAQKSLAEEKRKITRGQKFHCLECDLSFYDLNDPDHSCPRCAKHKDECKLVG